jgi:hypothetical protein
VKRRTPFIAAAIALLRVLAYLGSSWGGWDAGFPQITVTSTANRSAASTIQPDKAEVPGEGARARATGFVPWGNPDAARPPKEPRKESTEDAEESVPHWCFRTFYPGLPWMMSSHERNTGNAARSDLEYIWNGERSLRMHYVSVGDPLVDPPQVLNAQRNVLWQAIQAEPFRGKRFVFRPNLRAMPGGNATAFLRSWDGATGTPQLAADRIDPAKTPTVTWGAAWGSPRLVLDVSADAKVIYYGIVQSGSRPVWIDHVDITAETSTGTLDTLPYMGRYLEALPALPIDANWVWDEPKNLDFEHVTRKDDAGTPGRMPPLPC